MHVCSCGCVCEFMSAQLACLQMLKLIAKQTGPSLHRGKCACNWRHIALRLRQNRKSPRTNVSSRQIFALHIIGLDGMALSKRAIWTVCLNCFGGRIYSRQDKQNGRVILTKGKRAGPSSSLTHNESNQVLGLLPIMMSDDTTTFCSGWQSLN